MSESERCSVCFTVLLQKFHFRSAITSALAASVHHTSVQVYHQIPEPRSLHHTSSSILWDKDSKHPCSDKFAKQHLMPLDCDSPNTTVHCLAFRKVTWYSWLYCRFPILPGSLSVVAIKFKVWGAIQKICHAFFDQIWPAPFPLSQTVTHEYHKYGTGHNTPPPTSYTDFSAVA